MLCQPFAWHTHTHTYCFANPQAFPLIQTAVLARTWLLLEVKVLSLERFSWSCGACETLNNIQAGGSSQGTGGALYVAPIDYFLSQWVTCLQNCSMSRQKPQSFSPCHGVQYTTYFPSHYFQAQHAARTVRRMPPKNTFLLRQTLTVFTSHRSRSFFRQKKKEKIHPSL